MDFTRRDVNRSLLATALLLVSGQKTIARSPVPLFNFAIAGGHYYGLRNAMERIAPGTRLALVREATNAHDPDAVAVYLDNAKLGFIPRDANSPVARLLDSGKSVTADVIALLDLKHDSDVPDDLVFTGFASGDPMIRLTLQG